MYLTRALTYLGIVLLLGSCQDRRLDTGSEMPPLFPAPHRHAFNPGEGYRHNPVTGKAVQAMINSLGDTLVTGVPVLVTGTSLPPESLEKPEVVPAGRPSATPATLNIHGVAENLRTIPVHEGSLRKVTPSANSPAPSVVTSTGDTVLTGEPIQITGRPGPCYKPQPVKALLPARKDVTTIHMHYLDVEQGMNSSHVLSILEDHDGNLWFGTGGGGVSMYDGNAFTHYTEKEGLSNNIVWTVLEDRNGNLWFGTYGGGISRYDGKEFTHFTEKEGLSDNHIRSMMEDSRGNLWIGTWHGGASRYDGERITHFIEREGLCNVPVNAIYEDSQGRIWFGTNGRGVIVFDGETFTHFTEKDGLSNDVVLCVLEDSQGRMWFGTDGGGAVSYTDGAFTVYGEEEGLSNNSVRSIVEDRFGQLWFGTQNGGLNMFNGSYFSHYTEREGLSSDAVNTILEDRQGHLWIGTEYGGVSMYHTRSFTHFTLHEGMSDNRIRAMREDRDGNIWYGSWNGGVSLVQDGIIRHYSAKEGFCDVPVNDIYRDSHGNLWFGTEGEGAIMYNGNSFTHFGVAQGLGDNRVRTVLEDSRGHLWFGTWGAGLTRYDGDSFTRFSEREGFCNDYVRAILEDRNGQLWFGTYGGGVSVFDGETFTCFTEKEGLSNNVVLSMAEDSRGRLWFGTYGGGVSLLEGDSITHFTEQEGLTNNIVQSVQEDHLGHIWVSTEKGLNMLELEQESNPGQAPYPLIRNFGLQDGLRGSDFILNSVLRDRNDRIWWGSSKSLTRLDLNSFEIPSDPPGIQLNDITINDQFADYHLLNEDRKQDMTFNAVARFYNYPLGLELPYKNNHLTFHFSAIDWSAPHQIRYSFRIDGLDEDWSVPSPATSADYRKLPAGSYTFMVRAIGAAHTWSQTFEYPFIIKAPWWQTWWVRLGYAMALLAIVLIVVRWRTVNLMRQHRTLELQVREATHQIREQKEEIESQRDELLSTNEALEEQKKELQLTLRNLKTTQSQLIQSEKMASLGLLTAGIAHEMNNPVNFIGGSVNPLKRDLEALLTFCEKYDQILKTHKLDQATSEVNKLKEELDFDYITKEIMSLIEGIGEGATRSSQIVKGLRSFSRLDEEKWQLYDIHEGIESTLILLQNKTKNRIRIRTEFGKLKPIECQPSRLNQVILNVLNNSIQAIEGKGEVLIQTVESGIGIKIIIKDSGKGMTPEVQKQIFDPFFTTKEVGEGTGLGLSISYGIIEQHNGNIDVISEPGKGTEFIISLPLTQ